MARSSDSSFLMSILRDKTFQAREIRRVMVLATIYLLITTVVLGIFYHLLLGKLVSGTTPLFFVSEDMQRFDELIPGLAAVLGRWMLVMLAVNLILTVIISIYITRKLGHPIMAIKRALHDIGNGDLDVRLRETDDREFSDISSALNDAMAQIRMHVIAAKHEVYNLQKIHGTPAANESERDKSEMNTIVQNCASALNFFSAAESEDITRETDSTS